MRRAAAGAAALLDPLANSPANRSRPRPSRAVGVARGVGLATTKADEDDHHLRFNQAVQAVPDRFGKTRR